MWDPPQCVRQTHSTFPSIFALISYLPFNMLPLSRSSSQLNCCYCLFLLICSHNNVPLRFALWCSSVGESSRTWTWGMCCWTRSPKTSRWDNEITKIKSGRFIHVLWHKPCNLLCPRLYGQARRPTEDRTATEHLPRACVLKKVVPPLLLLGLISQDITVGRSCFFPSVSTTRFFFFSEPWSSGCWCLK